MVVCSLLALLRLQPSVFALVAPPYKVNKPVQILPVKTFSIILLFVEGSAIPATKMFWPPLEKAQNCSWLHYPAAGVERDVHQVGHCVRALPQVLIGDTELLCSVLALSARWGQSSLQLLL